MKNKLLSKLTCLQYIRGIKKLKKVLPIYKLLKETYKSQKNNLLISRKDCIPIPNMKDYYKDLKKNKIILPKKNVKKVFETPRLYFNIKLGDYLEVKE